jgi:aspartyl-tRNA(Asn)/glutamyl-tRNA(Gln) amidotransferase subunit A
MDDLIVLWSVLSGRKAPADESELRGLRIGIPVTHAREGVDPGVADVIQGTLQTLEGGGAVLIEIAAPDMEVASAAATAILMAEASATHLSQLRRDPEAYGEDVRQRLLVGLAIPAERYVRAQEVRRRLAADWIDRVFSKVDVVTTPTVLIPAPPIGEETTAVGGKPYNTRALLTRLTNPFNALGFPALSVPCGFARGLPMGLQVVGPPMQEERVLAVGAAYERLRGPFPIPDHFMPETRRGAAAPVPW